MAYHARDLRFAAFFIAFLCGLVALGFFASVHASTLVCRRASELATARCTIHRSGIFPFHSEIRAESIVDIDLRPGRKQPNAAEVVLELSPSFTPRVVQLEAKPFGGGVDLRSALEARARFFAFRSNPSVKTYEATFSRSTPTKAIFLVAGVLLATCAIWAVYDQLRQLREIRIVVDRERDVVVVGGHVVPIASVRGVVLEEGVVRTVIRNKNEPDIPGYRIAIVLENLEHITATRAWRPGPRAVHEAARQAVLDALTPTPLT